MTGRIVLRAMFQWLNLDRLNDRKHEGRASGPSPDSRPRGPSQKGRTVGPSFSKFFALDEQGQRAVSFMRARQTKVMQMFFAAIVAVANLGIGYWAARLARRGGSSRCKRWPQFRRALGIGLARSNCSARAKSVDKQIVQQTLNEIETVEQSLQRWLQLSSQGLPEGVSWASELRDGISRGITNFQSLQSNLNRNSTGNKRPSNVIERVEHAFNVLGTLLDAARNSAIAIDKKFISVLTTSVNDFLQICSEARGELNAMLFEQLETQDSPK
jgi:hypothetical protein